MKDENVSVCPSCNVAVPKGHRCARCCIPLNLGDVNCSIIELSEKVDKLMEKLDSIQDDVNSPHFEPISG